jgi:hypothetical protein
VTSNYRDTFITVAADCPADRGLVPPREGSIAGLQHALLTADPYRWTSDDLLFEVHARRHALPAHARDAERAAFDAKPRACLRASPLVKQFGWGLHHDANARVAAYAVDDPRYRELAAETGLRVVAGMRTRRA